MPDPSNTSMRTAEQLMQDAEVRRQLDDESRQLHNDELVKRHDPS